ncbi:MAG: tryptophan synthase subunit alpha, partial [Eudoraea sp.]|nr:tryptophan synthase subunit alpha [Eudoraea sp.]
MNRIKKKLKEPGKILSIYFTAGYPALNDTVRIIEELEKNGVDLIEIGLPFSDPLADGPTIQASS